jgi:hypothetical protein
METVPEPTAPVGSPRRRRKVAGAGLVAAGLVAGGVLASTLGASADTTSPTTGSSASSSANPGPGGAAPVRSDEKAVSSAQAATLKAAALKAVPGGTVIRIETDAGDGVYEAHMKKADGTLVTVKFDKNLAVTKVEAGMGQGDPAPAGRPAGGAAPSGGSGA